MPPGCRPAGGRCDAPTPFHRRGQQAEIDPCLAGSDQRSEPYRPAGPSALRNLCRGPLAAKGLLMARMVADTLVLAVLAIVVMLSRKWGAIVVILLGLAAYVASFLPTGEWSSVSSTIARHGGEML